MHHAILVFVFGSLPNHVCWKEYWKTGTVEDKEIFWDNVTKNFLTNVVSLYYHQFPNDATLFDATITGNFHDIHHNI